MFDTQASELCTTHRDCGRAAGYEGCKIGDHNVQRVSLDAQECHKAGPVSQLQAAVSNPRLGKFARLFKKIHSSMEHSASAVFSVPITVKLWWLPNGISGLTEEKALWRLEGIRRQWETTSPAQGPRKAMQMVIVLFESLAAATQE